MNAMLNAECEIESKGNDELD